MERLCNYVYGEPVQVQSDHKPLDLEEVNCCSKPKTSKATIEACKIQDSIRVHQGKGQLNSRYTEYSRSTQSRTSGCKADGCNSSASDY